MSTKTLTADSDYNTAGKQYVARITGRNAKFTFARAFIGQRSGKRNDHTEAMVDESGLYETRDTDRKGVTDSYLILWCDGDQLRATDVSREDAMAIARRLDGGTVDLERLGRAAEIKSQQKAIAASESKDPEGTVTLGAERLGQWTRGAVVRRSDLIARHVARRSPGSARCPRRIVTHCWRSEPH